MSNTGSNFQQGPRRRRTRLRGRLRRNPSYPHSGLPDAEATTFRPDCAGNRNNAAVRFVEEVAAAFLPALLPPKSFPRDQRQMQPSKSWVSSREVQSRSRPTQRGRGGIGSRAEPHNSTRLPGLPSRGQGRWSASQPYARKINRILRATSAGAGNVAPERPRRAYDGGMQGPPGGRLSRASQRLNLPR
jgi:hypothetical protein